MRKLTKKRSTKETDIFIALNLDGKGNTRINTGIPFLNHMLELFGKHGLLDLEIRAKGDIDVDYHHTVEDIGIVLGDAFKDAVKDRSGIRRYGEAVTPMDETLVSVAVDISGRPYLVYNVRFQQKAKIKDFDQSLAEDFFQAFVSRSGTTMHINLYYGRNNHHILEAIFKGFGRAIRDAVTLDARIKGVQSTKGRI